MKKLITSALFVFALLPAAAGAVDYCSTPYDSADGIFDGCVQNFNGSCKDCNTLCVSWCYNSQIACSWSTEELDKCLFACSVNNAQCILS